MTNLPEKQKGRKAAKYRGASCLNCGHPLDLSDVYCSYCGQLNSTKQLSLGDFFKEFLSSIVNYDSRLRHTVKDLLFKPGTITKNYVEGKRLKYANPFRFFLSASIIYFLFQSLFTVITGESNMVNFDGDGKNKIENANVITFNNKDYKISEGEEVQLVGQDSLIIGKDTILLNEKKTTKVTYLSETDLDTLSNGEALYKRFELYRDFYKETEIKDPVKALDSLNHENTAYNRWMYNKNNSIDRIQENPFGFANYLMNKVPFFIFFFSPFFALFFWLLYSKKKYTYMEHLVFIFHIFGFVFLAMLLCLIPDLIIGDDILQGILLSLIGPFYFYKALRNFYKQNRFITIIKFILLNIVFGISATITAILFFAVTAAAY